MFANQTRVAILHLKMIPAAVTVFAGVLKPPMPASNVMMPPVEITTSAGPGDGPFCALQLFAVMWLPDWADMPLVPFELTKLADVAMMRDP